jgi:adenine phosphoribosyltransferase
MGEEFKKVIREIPDFPKPGILFYDLTTLMKDKTAFRKAIDSLAARYQKQPIDLIVGIEARGFIFASTLAYKLETGFVPIRKPGKLPAETTRIVYDLEYGSDALEIHKDAIQPQQNVLIVDDLLATGGTAKAVTGLVETLGGQIVGLAFLVELEFLKGRNKLAPYDIFSFIKY